MQSCFKSGQFDDISYHIVKGFDFDPFSVAKGTIVRFWSLVSVAKGIVAKIRTAHAVKIFRPKITAWALGWFG